MTFVCNDPGTPNFQISLIGNGIPGNIAVDPDTLDFGDVGIGYDFTQILTISNTGMGTLDISEIASDNTVFTSDITNIILDTGSYIEVGVTFMPDTSGIANATLSIANDDPDTPLVSIPLSGFGMPGSIGLTPDTLNFGDIVVGETSTLALTVENTGLGILEVSDIFSDHMDFTAEPPTSFTLDASESRDVNVTFTATW